MNTCKILCSCLVFAVPRNVRNLTHGDIGQSFINLKWTKPLGLYSSFRIVYGKTGQSSVTVNVGDVQQREINDLTAGTIYTNDCVYTKRK